MHADRTNWLEKILRLCAESAPRPWYPRAYATYSGADRDTLEDALEQVWLERLVERAGESKEDGAGFVLSPLGERVLRDPEALARLREGRPVDEGDPGAVVRHGLRRPARPVVGRLLLAANLLVFGYGLYLAVTNARARPGLVDAFLSGGLLNRNAAVAQRVGEGLQAILYQSGSLSAQDLLRGQWWRMLTCAFVHAGLLHLGLNMYMLYRIGAAVEQAWGRWRFLVIYFLAAWGGSCVALAYQPVIQVAPGVERPYPLVGASGALCGIFGAEAAWVLLYGRYLPPGMARRGRRILVVNLLLLTFISLLPGVSGWAHLGGGLTGAAAALVLHGQRFGPRGWRWLALAALPAVAWAPWAVLQRQQARSPRWAKLIRAAELEKEEQEERDFERRFLSPRGKTFIPRVMDDAEAAYDKQVRELLNMHATRRDPDRVNAALAVLGEQRRTLADLADALRGAGPYHSETAEGARQTALEYAEARAKWYAAAEGCLKAGPRCTRKDEERLRQREKEAAELRERWDQLFEKPAR